MLPPNLINKVKQQEEEQQKTIANNNTGNITNKAPVPLKPVNPAIANSREQKSQPTNQQTNTNTNENNTSSRNNDFRRIIYLTYDKKTVETVLDINAIDSQFVSAFPSGIIINRVNKIITELGFLTPGTLYIQGDNTNINIDNLMEEIRTQYYVNASIINLSLYNLLLNSKNDNNIIQMGYIPIRTAMFNEFVPTFKEILKLFTENKLKDYVLPEHIIIPLPVFSNRNDIYDTTQSMKRLCVYLQTYITYDQANDLLLFQLSNIEGCQYNQYISGYIITIPINKFSARLIYSAFLSD